MSTIGNLPVLSSVTGTMVLPIVDTTTSTKTTKQVTVNALGNYINSNLTTFNLAAATTSTLGGVTV